MNSSKIRILYLAKYAPIEDNYIPEFDEKDGISPIYHYEIYSVLKQLGYNVTGSRSIDFLYLNAKKFDYVFSLYNRLPFRNSEIFVSSLCEYLKLPYLGSNPVVRSIAEDKNLAKIFACHSNVPTPSWHNYRKNEDIFPPKFEPPYFIKPRYGASSEFVDESSLADTWEEAKERIQFLLDEGIEVIVEQFVPGINLTLPVVFCTPPLVLSPTMSTSNLRGNILSYKQKRLIEKGIQRTIFENIEIARKMVEFANAIYDRLSSPLDYARFDFRYNQENKEIFFLEFNVCCNLGIHSSICQGAKHIGLTQIDIVKKILEYSLSRQNFRR